MWALGTVPSGEADPSPPSFPWGCRKGWPPHHAGALGHIPLDCSHKLLESPLSSGLSVLTLKHMHWLAVSLPCSQAFGDCQGPPQEVLTETANSIKDPGTKCYWGPLEGERGLPQMPLPRKLHYGC